MFNISSCEVRAGRNRECLAAMVDYCVIGVACKTVALQCVMIVVSC